MTGWFHRSGRSSSDIIKGFLVGYYYTWCQSVFELYIKTLASVTTTTIEKWYDDVVEEEDWRSAALFSISLSTWIDDWRSLPLSYLTNENNNKVAVRVFMVGIVEFQPQNVSAYNYT
jgi:hypothetical protein